jgi:hypothetical protein
MNQVEQAFIILKNEMVTVLSLDPQIGLKGIEFVKYFEATFMKGF